MLAQPIESLTVGRGVPVNSRPTFGRRDASLKQTSDSACKHQNRWQGYILHLLRYANLLKSRYPTLVRRLWWNPMNGSARIICLKFYCQQYVPTES